LRSPKKKKDGQENGPRGSRESPSTKHEKMAWGAKVRGGGAPKTPGSAQKKTGQGRGKIGKRGKQRGEGKERGLMIKGAEPWSKAFWKKEPQKVTPGKGGPGLDKGKDRRIAWGKKTGRMVRGAPATRNKPEGESLRMQETETRVLS